MLMIDLLREIPRPNQWIMSLIVSMIATSFSQSAFSVLKILEFKVMMMVVKETPLTQKFKEAIEITSTG